MRIVPLTLRQANALVMSLHRHHKPVQGHRFSIGLLNASGTVIGAAIIGRPVSRHYDPYNVAEVTRLVTDGTPNACSMLYSAAARACKAQGYSKIQTYILDSEPGTSLKASGWMREVLTRGGDWNRTSRTRRIDQPMCMKVRWAKQLAADCKEAR